MASTGFFENVWAFVARIPRGKVATYGQIAAFLGNPRAARTVGWALHSMPEELELPWHRVVNSRGRTSTDRLSQAQDMQRRLLESEGVEFDSRGVMDLARFQWTPDSFVNDDSLNVNSR